MFLVRWLLCLTLLTPLAGVAQASQNGPPASSEERSSFSPPPLVPAPEETPPRGESIPYSYRGESADESQRPSHSRLPTVARISLEVMGGVAGGAVSGLLGVLAGEVLFGSCGDDTSCILTILGTTGGAIFLATPLAVYAVGHLTGGRGSYWSSLLGMAVGTLAGGVMFAVFNNKSEELQIASIVTFPVLGAVLGYELRNARQQSDSAGRTRAGAAGASPQLIPLVSFTRAGGVFGGLAARF